MTAHFWPLLLDTHTHTRDTFHSMDALLISGLSSPFPPPKARYSLKVFIRWQVNTSIVLHKYTIRHYCSVHFACWFTWHGNKIAILKRSILYWFVLAVGATYLPCMMCAQARIDCDFEWKWLGDESRGVPGRRSAALQLNQQWRNWHGFFLPSHQNAMASHNCHQPYHTRATNRVAIVCIALAYDSSAWHLYHAIC